MPNPAHHTAYIGLGSNLGRRADTLRGALEALDQMPGVSVLRVSRFLETAPVGGPPQARYVNAAAELGVTLSPFDLLMAMHEVEDRFGRVRTVHWGSRTLDLDLLLFNDLVLDEPGLRVPHPLLHERVFVLEPLCEIAPDVMHPVLRRTVRELWDELAP